MSKGVEIPARIPIRRHGVARVEAILEAATKLFAERGLQGTTMSAVAEESGTAPGSLYRFFRNRDEVWDALLDRYVALRYDQLSELRACAPLMTTQELARHMVQDMQNRFQLRKLAMSFLEIREDLAPRRRELRLEILRRTADVLQAHAPEADPERLPVIARMASQMLRMVAGLEKVEADGEGAVMPELERALCLYLTDTLRRVS
ncbi:TetR/AcrR family transcriptional regulator [Gluconobacter wancherniae]|uniref:TetR/AcrR family transcriptional regulator n=1 Tax=Gluconobacter wancherniae TaxID=1307955 RepID=UPI001B8BE0B8|nr:TetR/AcrR family transcriptional regulator [Gluconobacter wancherniae]MBS1064032.1 TetR/AcrR family transcriptional regulator [Gluconobacter wancherniae]MBS1095580.1 TetR/AcrR family transcriptional regulator [Gluconobacter wancherniae]